MQPLYLSVDQTGRYEFSYKYCPSQRLSPNLVTMELPLDSSLKAVCDLIKRAPDLLFACIPYKNVS